MMLAIAIAATFIFVEFMALVILSFMYDGLKGVEIWLGLNQYFLMGAGLIAVVVGIVALWVIAL